MDFSKLDGIFKHETIFFSCVQSVYCNTFWFPGIEKFACLDDTVNLAGSDAVSIDGNCNIVLLLCVSPELEQN
jgi:hypothetical protein